ncbi:MAG: hypothetical protein KC503_08155 [Myxococcales bacterium]|nr:hypothetical protein [Myxococcales bacterium]
MLLVSLLAGLGAWRVAGAPRRGVAAASWRATDVRIVERPRGFAVLVLERQRMDQAGRLVLHRLDDKLAQRQRPRVIGAGVAAFDAAAATARQAIGVGWIGADKALYFDVLAAARGLSARAPIDHEVWSPRVRWSGRDFVLAWIATRDGVRSVRAEANGKLRGAARTLAGNAGVHMTGYLGLAARGDELVVSYATYDIYPYRASAYDADLSLAHLVGDKLTHVHVGSYRNTPSFGDSTVARAADGWLVGWEVGRAVGLARYAGGKVTPLRFRGGQDEQAGGPELLRVDGGFALAHSDGRSARVARLDEAARQTAATRLSARHVGDVSLAAGDDARVALAFAQHGAVELALLGSDGEVERRVRLPAGR